ncbi:MAG: cobalt ECF transporter T component CbiQ [Halopseudomonas sp.]
MNPLAALAIGEQPAWLSARDPRVRVLAALLFALTVVSLHHPSVLLVALLCAVALAMIVRLSLSMLLKRLIAFEGFMLLVLLLLPFSIPGEAWLQLGSFSASVEGVERALVIVLRANAVVVVLLSLVGTLEPEVLGHTLARLRLPDKLVHLFLLTVRYVSVLFDEYQRLRVAMRARCFSAGSNRHTWRTLGWLIGMLLVRSLERSQRILAAMKCRGFHGRFFLLDQTVWRWGDSLALAAFALLPVSLLLWERLL